MTSPKPNPLVRWLPSLTDLAFLMPLVFLFAKMEGIRSMLGDGDTGWHIRIGEWMLANGRIPRADFFSFTMPNAPFYAWEWLWDLAFGWINLHGGMSAVVMVNMTILALTFALLFRLVLRMCGNPLVAIFCTMVATAASSIHWLARPHLVTMLFVVIFLSRLETVRESGDSWRGLVMLPVLTVLWTNLHGGFFVGLLLLLCYAVGEGLRGLVEGQGIPKKAYWFAWTGVACFGASFINPYFYELHRHIAQYFIETYHMEVINEFQSISFHFATARYFEIMMILGVAAAFWYFTQKKFYAVFLLLGWMHLALIAGRNIAIFAIIAAPLVAQALVQLLASLAERTDVARGVREWTRGFLEFSSELGQIDRLPRAHVVCVAVVALVTLAAQAPDPPALFRSDYNPEKYPAAAIELLRGAEFSNSIFTNDEWGDYLIYRMYPETKVFVDGRSDFYGGKFGRSYLDIMNVKWGWEDSLGRYGVDTVLLPPDAPLAGAMKESARWCLVYDDQVSLIFRHRNTRACADVATEFAAKHRSDKSVVARSRNSEQSHRRNTE